MQMIFKFSHFHINKFWVNSVIFDLYSEIKYSNLWNSSAFETVFTKKYKKEGKYQNLSKVDFLLNGIQTWHIYYFGFIAVHMRVFILVTCS